ncbi:MAG: 30S ribosomal protein S27ae [Methanopyri archaeon]|nr:30S ribosomal protein S27ae [Methanopyri archaeon]
MPRRARLYEVKDGKVERKNPFCPRCGPGVFMADHGNRYACGKCGYTEFKSQPESKKG